MSIKNIISLAFICEDEYIKSLSVALVSMLENVDSTTHYDIHVLSKNSYTKEHIDSMDSLQEKYSCDISFIKVKKINKDSAEEISKLVSTSLKKIDKCIYLDYNVVVQKDLSGLYNFNLDDCSVGGVNDVDTDKINPNVLLIDCAKVRKINTINVCEIDLKFNLLADYFLGEKSFNFGKKVTVGKEVIEVFDKKQLREAFKENVIFSYTDKVNPQTIDNCSFTVEWWKYFRLSLKLKVEKATPKVSVIIPVYNVEQYIAECLDSVVNQTLQDIEIILVDDGSTDKSLEIMIKYANLDSRIIILQQENQGAGVARNKGLDIAKGEYLSFLDPDDFFELTMLEQTYTKAIENDIDIVVFDYLMFNQSTSKFIPTQHKLPTSYGIFYYKDMKDNIFSSLHDQAWNKIFKTDFIKKNNLRFQHLFRTNDVYFTNSAIACAKRIKVLDKHLAYYRIGTKNNAQATLHLHPLSFYTAELGLRDKFKEIGIYSEIEKGFLNKVLNDSIGNMNRNKNIKAVKTIYNHIKENLNKDFGITKHPKEYYSTQLYDRFIFIKDNTFDNYMSIKTNKPIKKDYNYYKNLSPDLYEQELKEWYKRATGENLDLENPKTFNEKIQWLKLYDSTPLKTQLADKYLVRDWIKEKIGEEYLIPLLGVWDNFDEIDFDKLPNQFALKTNHGSGWNYIVNDKSKFDKNDAKKKFDIWLQLNYAYLSFELHYMNIKPKIIAEQYIQNANDLYDYKFMCFNGNVEFLWIVSNKSKKIKRTFFDTKFKMMDFKFKNVEIDNQIIKPINFNNMINISKKLSRNFSCVRIDFYEINNKLYFGEMTFTSSSGTEVIEPEKFKFKYGDLIKLPPKSDLPILN